MYHFIVHFRDGNAHGEKKFNTFKWALMWARAHKDFAILSLDQDGKHGRYCVVTKGFEW